MKTKGKPYKVIHSYVYVVYECSEIITEDHDSGVTTEHFPGKIHGVYVNENEAIGKADSLDKRKIVGWISVLKKPVLGKTYNKEFEHQVIFDSWLGD